MPYCLAMRNGDPAADGHEPDRGARPAGSVQSVDRAVTILELLAHQGVLGVTELARELNVHKSTASRLVAALENRGLVEKVEERGKLRLGSGILRLAGATTARLDLVKEVRPVTRRLAASTGETVNLAVLTTNAALYIDQSVAPTSTPSYDWVGQHIPLHATSNGKILLSEVPADEVSSYVRELPAITPRTITTRTALRDELATVRQRGYAVAVDELEAGLTAVAAPIRNEHGEIVASLSVSGPTYRFTTARLEVVVPDVQQAARDASGRLGWSDGRPDISPEGR